MSDLPTRLSRLSRRFRERLGVGVGRDAVRALLLSGGRVVWAEEAPAGDGRPLADAVAALLARAPARRWPRPAVVAAVGPWAAQTRLLRELPPLRDDAALAALVRESAGRFFLRNGIPLVTTGVRRGADAGVWAGAIERPVCAALDDACRRQGLRLRAAVPAMAVLAHALGDGVHRWSDGDVVAEGTYGRGRLASLRRLPAPWSGEAMPPAEGGAERAAPTATVAPPLAALGSLASRFADAYAAAVLPAAEPLAWRAERDGAAAPVSGRRLGAAALACALGVSAALAAPALGALRATREAGHRLTTLAGVRGEAARAERELAGVTGALRAAAEFGAGAPSRTLFLASLTRHLPESTMLVALRVDSVGGSLTALAPRAAAVVGQLGRVPEIAAPTLAGAVTPETVAGRPVERATVRFRWRARSGALQEPFEPRRSRRPQRGEVQVRMPPDYAP